MNTEKKILIGIGVLTLVLIIAGVMILTRGENKSVSSQQNYGQTILLSNAQHTKGDPNAPVKIVEFADFQCPACATAHPIIKKVVEENAEKSYFVFRHYPLSIHKNAKLAAQACEAAGEQGKFWEMHDLLFENQNQWSQASGAKEMFENYAGQLNLDLVKFKSDFDEGIGLIEQDFADGNRVGVDSTPTFFINGVKYPGVISEAQLNDLIDKEIK
ncbi:DsbA family protein [Candidatus Curtissbacteria bacterium]|nr:DsbA family protein [Candidatus Curtissbacteria bacterium]